MKKRDDSVFLNHIVDSISEIESFTLSLSKEKFQSSKLHQNAVIRCLEVIGQSVKNVSTKTRELDSEIPWQDIAGMRDVLIHQYFGVDINEVWSTVENDLIPLKKQILDLFDKL